MQPLTKPHAFLYWAAPPPADSEFTPEDPLALDYLAQQVGLWLLPRFTTRTNSAQYYAVVLYGLHLARQVQEDRGLPRGDEQLLQLFERWERFWALSVLESRGGPLGRGDPDAIRGIRGATAAWRPGEGKLPLDFPLISRQLELGGLGAYLSSLRATGLVFPGSLRPSPAAQAILQAFWRPAKERDQSGRYASFARLAVDPDTRKVPRKYGNRTLARVGELTRLTSLGHHPEQQANLELYLVGERADERTRSMAQLVEAAWHAGVVDPREFLSAAIDGDLGETTSDLAERLRGARAYGDAHVALLEAFQAMYRAVQRQAIAPRAEVIREVFTDERLHHLGATAGALLERDCVRDFNALAVHGGTFIRCLRQLTEASGVEALDAVLAMHRTVQRDRRRGNGWLVDDGEHLVVGPSNFTTSDAVPFPDLKLRVVRSLLRDVGRVTEPSTTEAAS